MNLNQGSAAKLILASASPRRRELLAQAGYSFDVLPAHIDETRRHGEAPHDYVQRLALEKAQAVLNLHPDATVLGADTTVVLDGEILNKPPNRAAAEAMLRALSGRSHLVQTGIAVLASGRQNPGVDTPLFEDQAVETTTVWFNPIPAAELAHYLASGDSLDKAGAYGIQGYAARWIPRIEGDFFNVMGLPIATTVRLLQAGVRASAGSR